MKVPIIAFLLLFVFSCQPEELPEDVPQSSIEIIPATADETNAFVDYLTGGNPNARVRTEFSPDKLVRITDGSFNRWAAPSSADSNKALSFSINQDRTIDKAFISQTALNSDNSITSRIYDTSNRLMMEFVYTKDGHREVIYKDQLISRGFWAEWDKCLDTIGEPFPNNVSNIIFDYAANMSTLGAWTPAVGIVCLGVAGGLNYMNNQRK